MTMTRRFVMMAMMAVTVALGMTSVVAHEDFRIIGTIEKVTEKTVDVKQTKDGQVVSMRIGTKMTVTRDKKPVERTELKVGAHVVVNARGDSLKDLVAVDVRLVPAPAPK
jgi:hypothetical protein